MFQKLSSAAMCSSAIKSHSLDQDFCVGLRIGACGTGNGSCAGKLGSGASADDARLLTHVSGGRHFFGRLAAQGSALTSKPNQYNYAQEASF